MNETEKMVKPTIEHLAVLDRMHPSEKDGLAVDILEDTIRNLKEQQILIDSLRASTIYAKWESAMAEIDDLRDKIETYESTVNVVVDQNNRIHWLKERNVKLKREVNKLSTTVNMYEDAPLQIETDKDGVTWLTAAAFGTTFRLNLHDLLFCFPFEGTKKKTEAFERALDQAAMLGSYRSKK